MKSIILTYAPVSDYEKELLQKTNIFKLALNQHAKEYLPNARIIADYTLRSIVSRFGEKIISVRDKSLPESDKIEYFRGKFKGSTIVAAIDYLISKQYDEILIIGNNQVNNLKFRNEVNVEVSKLKESVKIYQYSDGNFDLPIKSISEFCNF